jgi:hypothetical protein
LRRQGVRKPAPLLPDTSRIVSAPPVPIATCRASSSTPIEPGILLQEAERAGLRLDRRPTRALAHDRDGEGPDMRADVYDIVAGAHQSQQHREFRSRVSAVSLEPGGDEIASEGAEGADCAFDGRQTHSGLLPYHADLLQRASAQGHGNLRSESKAVRRLVLTASVR